MLRHFPDQKQYLAKARSLIFNFRDKNNNWLKESILAGSMDVNQVVKVNPKELASDVKKQ